MSLANPALNAAHASNAPMPKPLRTQLENTVNAARDMAEKVGKAALTQLAVAEAKAPDYLNETQRVVRRKFRSHARAISAGSYQNESVDLMPLVWEVAYEHWHRMLPQVFKPQSPVFELSFTPEDQRALEKLLANLPAEVFQASNSLGWGW